MTSAERYANMTVAEKFANRPFAMMNTHRNWCRKQMQPFCVKSVLGLHETKFDWQECPNRQVCFAAFIHSTVEV